MQSFAGFLLQKFSVNVYKSEWEMFSCLSCECTLFSSLLSLLCSCFGHTHMLIIISFFLPSANLFIYCICECGLVTVPIYFYMSFGLTLIIHFWLNCDWISCLILFHSCFQQKLQWSTAIAFVRNVIRLLNCIYLNSKVRKSIFFAWEILNA